MFEFKAVRSPTASVLVASLVLLVLWVSPLVAGDEESNADVQPRWSVGDVERLLRREPVFGGHGGRRLLWGENDKWREITTIATVIASEQKALSAGLLAILNDSEQPEARRMNCLPYLEAVLSREAISWCATHIELYWAAFGGGGSRTFRALPAQHLLRTAGWRAVPAILENLEAGSLSRRRIGLLTDVLREVCGRDVAYALLQAKKDEGVRGVQDALDMAIEEVRRETELMPKPPSAASGR